MSTIACIIWGLFIGYAVGGVIQALQRIADVMEQQNERGRQSW